MTDESKRSGVVTAAAVIALVGSVGALLFGSMTLLGGFLASGDPSFTDQSGDPSDAPSLAVFLIMGGGQLALSAWGIVSAVGLLRLRNWARLSFVVFAALLAVASSCAVLGLMVAIPALSLVPDVDPNIPPGVMAAVLSVMALIAVSGVGVGIWWVIYFNRARVRSQFISKPVEMADRPRPPVRITVVAWLLVANGLFLPLHLTATHPTVLFGVVVRGWPGRGVVVAQLVVACVAGIGLLRKRAGAHTLAVGLYVFGLLNFAATLIVPGGPARLRETYQQVFADQRMPESLVDWAMWSGTALSLVVGVLFLWLLMSRRRAFLLACAPAPRVPDIAL